MKVVWTQRALRRLQHIQSYISKDQPINAMNFIGRLVTLGESLNEQPYRGRSIPEYTGVGLREVREGDYRIIYRFRAGAIEILTVRHRSQLLPIEPSQL